MTPEELIPHYIAGDKPSHAKILKPQLEHRINLVHDVWQVPAGSRVLEIGCGQGDTTLVLADAVGPQGQVVALDPCDLDYGSPYTVGQAQEHLKNGVFGSRITFVQADPESYIKGRTVPDGACAFDIVVLSHCLWYFSSLGSIRSLLGLLAEKRYCKKVAIAEWSLRANRIEQVPHVHAAMTAGAKSALNQVSQQPGDTTANIRSPFSVAWMRNLLKNSQYTINSEAYIEVPLDMADGRWEVDTIISEDFANVTAPGSDDDEEALGTVRHQVNNLRNATIEALEAIDGNTRVSIKRVQCMLVWACMLSVR